MDVRGISSVIVTHVLLRRWTHQLCFKFFKLFHLLLSHRYTFTGIFSDRLSRLNMHVDCFLYSLDPISSGLNVFRAQNNAFGQACELEFSSKNLIDFAFLKGENTTTVK